MANIFNEIIEETKQDIENVDNELKTFRSIFREFKQGKWKSLETKTLSQSIIKNLLQEKEDLKCRIQLYQSFLPKRRESLRQGKNLEQ